MQFDNTVIQNFETLYLHLKILYLAGKKSIQIKNLIQIEEDIARQLVVYMCMNSWEFY